MHPLRWRWFWLAGGWAMVAATVLVSLVPMPPGPETVSDKLVHALVYGALALWFCGIYHRSRHWRVALWLATLGLAIELLQGVGGTRHLEGADALANVAGILTALTIARVGLDGWCRRVEMLLSSAFGTDSQ